MVMDDARISRRPPRPAACHACRITTLLLVAIAATVGGGGGRLACAEDDVVVEPAEPVSAIQTNVIESLTPAEARKLLLDFVPGAQIEVNTGAACITRPHCLHLNALTSLDTETAAVLAASKGWEGTLPQLATLKPDVAAFKGADLHLSGLTAISPETAAALAGSQAANLHLGGVTAIDAETAQALAAVKAKLVLPELAARLDGTPDDGVIP